MKRIITALMAIIMIGTFTCSMPVNAATDLSYTSNVVTEEGRFGEDATKKSFKKIVRSYKELQILKKQIKKKYKNPKKYLKQLNKYKKSYFRKYALVFVTDTVDVNHRSYELIGVEKNNSKIVLSINKYYNVPEGLMITCNIIDSSQTYFLKIRKSKIKKVKSIKIKYSFVENVQEKLYPR